MADSSNKILKNTSWIIGARTVQALLNMVISMLTARYLGPSNYGLISYAASVVSFVIPVMQLGLNGILVQEIVNKPDKEGKILGTSLVMSLVSSIACMVGAVSFVFFVNAGETDTIIVCALYSLLLPISVADAMHFWFQAKLESKYVSLTSLGAYVVVSAYKIYLLVSGKSIYWFAIINALDSLIIGVTLLIIYNKKKTYKLSFSWALVGELFKKSKYYIISNLMVTVFAQTDRIMLKNMIDDAAVGFYNSAVNIAGMTSFVFGAIIDSMRPVIFESIKSSKELYEKNVVRLYSIIIYLSLAQSIVIAAAAPLIVWILYGSQYAGTVDILRMLVWYTTFSYVGSVRNIWILAENKQKYLWVLNLSGAVLNVALNYVLIPIMGGVGAALASFVTQLGTNVFISFIIKPIRYSNTLMFKGLNIFVLKDMFVILKTKLLKRK